tara:strand:- start:1542 stop:2174 length:633 start_codon:yes stop_codon:yes gene_type:complete
MFIWIAVASVIVGVAVVVSIFLVQKLYFNELVLSKKLTTAERLDKNLETIEELKTEIQALGANTDLAAVKANEGDQAIQVVLDALPAEANSFALGASLQKKLLNGIEGNYSLDSLQVLPVEGIEELSSGNSDEESASDTSGRIYFSFTVKGDQNALKQVFRNLERSIRAMVITSVAIEYQSDVLTMDVEGHAFYEPATILEVTTETVKAE